MAITFPSNASDGQIHAEISNGRYYMYNHSEQEWYVVRDYVSKNEFVIKSFDQILDREYDEEGWIYYMRQLSDTSDYWFLRQLYELLFEQTRVEDIDQDEFNGYLEALAPTGDRKDILRSLLNTERYNTLRVLKPSITVIEFSDNSLDADYVTSLYRNLLNREPDPEGFTYLTSGLELGTFDRPYVVDYFLDSSEFNDVPDIKILYGTVPKAMRLIIADDLLLSYEFSERFKTNDLFVNALYEKTLDRSPEEGGYNYWMDILNKETMTRGEVVRQFLHSSEFKVSKTLLYSLIHDEYEKFNSHVSKSKVSYQINSQVPEFVRQDHPAFIQFLEEYYRFLEEKDNTGNVAKNFDMLLDPDKSEGIFLEKLYDNFINLIPKNVLADKNLILKHAKEFYRSRGTEKSARYLMRILFNKDVDFYFPKQDVLRVSDGKWYQEKALRIAGFKVDNVANTEPTLSSYFVSKRVVGQTSNAHAIVEKVEQFYDKGEAVTELKLTGLFREFIDGETLYTEFIEHGVTKSLTANIYSGVIVHVDLIKGGSSYVEGTTVPIVSNTGSKAQIIVSKTTKGGIQGIIPTKPGAGFKVADNMIIAGGDGVGANANVYIVRDDGYYHPNTYNFISSTIDLVANVSIDSEHYANLVPSISYPYLYPIKDSMSFWTYANTGPVDEIFVISAGTNYTSFPNTIQVIANTVVASLGILGRMEIIDGGTGYNIGDVIQFTNPRGGYGAGALGKVFAVDENKGNTITEVHFVEMAGHIIGGSGYSQNYLPTANVISNTGYGADIQVTAVLGDGDEFVVTESVLVGTIKELTIINGGIGYTEPVTLDFTGIGDGTAQAAVSIINGAVTYPGRYINQDGQLSANKFIQDRDFYQDYSYVVKIDEPLDNWRKPYEELVHPSGMKLFAEYASTDNLNKMPSINSPSHYDYVFKKGSYSTTSRGFVLVSNTMTNLTLSTIGSDQANSNEYFVKYLFRHLLERDPDQGGYEYYLRLLNDGVSRNLVTADFLGSKEYNGLILSNSYFVKYLYKLFFNRKPDTGGYYYWLNLLDSGTLNRKQLISYFVGSNEYSTVYVTNSQFVTSLFNKLLFRDYDQGGYDYYVNLLNTGTSRQFVVNDFLNSSEYAVQTRPGFEYITSLYNKIFNRNPDSEGLVYWLDQVNQSGLSQSLLISEFQKSADYSHTPQFDNMLVLNEWTSNSNVWFAGITHSNKKYFAKIYDTEYEIVSTDERSGTVTIDTMIPGGISGLPLEIVERQDICNVTITLANHGLASGNTVYLQFLPNNSVERSNVIVEFVNSKEYNSYYGKSDGTFVTSLYKNLLFRDPDKTGYDYWTNQIYSGAKTRAQVSYDFVHSVEFEEFNSVSHNLLYEIDNGAFVSTLYDTYFRRKPDELGYVYWINRMTPTANNLRSGPYNVTNVLSSSQFVIVNNNTTNHTGNVMIAKA